MVANTIKSGFFSLFLSLLLWASLAVGQVTPNILRREELWTRTSADTQLVLGLLEVAGGVTLTLAWQDPEVRKASRIESIKRRTAQKENAKWQQQELRRQAVEFRVQALEREAETTRANITHEKQMIEQYHQKLLETEDFLPAGRKQEQLAEIRKRIADLYAEILPTYNAPLNKNPASAFEYYPQHKQEYDRLLSEESRISAMPDLTEQAKRDAVRNLENLIKDSEKKQNTYASELTRIQTDVKMRSREIEQMAPNLTKLEQNYQASETELQNAANALADVLVRKRFITRFIKFSKVGIDGLLALDVGKRIVYWYFLEEDPGLFPLWPF